MKSHAEDLPSQGILVEDEADAGSLSPGGTREEARFD